MIKLGLGIVVAYLLGSIPTAVWIGRIFYGVDVRTQGSGNAGATNTIRVLGAGAGIPVLAFDIFKSWLAVILARYFGSSLPLESNYLINYQILLGVVAVIGHIFPVYVGFKGGKGVASLVGILIALFPVAFFIALGIFIVVYILWKYISLSSIVAAITFPFIETFLLHQQHLSLIIFSFMVGIFVPITHRKNISRLLKGEEHKFLMKPKKRKDH
ncbi:MAG TPA: glycerol-3-phosphate 1-O-acyltransferase PlsY [Bacteroidales bacterium]|nr:glycerol-3-phosphate 1-O-acyltransferase PlsY [Bacteroidales bacterium]